MIRKRYVILLAILFWQGFHLSNAQCVFQVSVSASPEYCGRSDGTAGISPLGGTGPYTYVWSPGGQTTSALTGLVAGTYSVAVVDAAACTADTVLTVPAVAGPTAVAGAGSTICEGTTVPLSGSGGGSYQWAPSIWLNNSTLANPSAFPGTTTTFTLTVTDANGCSDTDTVRVHVYARPVASFSATAACFNNPTQFTDLSSGVITNWDWNFGDGNLDSVQNPSHTYSAFGSFVVFLVVTSPDGCKDTLGKPVIVNPLPAVNFTYQPVCIGTPTCFQDLSTIPTGTITAWSWNFGDTASGSSNISNLQHPCHAYSDTGAFNVVLTVTSNQNCQSTTILPAVVFPPPTAIFSAPDVCLNNPTLFSDNSNGATNWNWDFGDGGNSTQQNPSHTYLAYGNYAVTLIASSTGSCIDTVTDTITVHPLPVPVFVSDTVCLGDSTSLIDLSFIPAGSIIQWHWDFGDGDTSSMQNPFHVFASSGTHSVTLQLGSANSCTAAVTSSVEVHSPPLANFSFIPAPSVSLIEPAEFQDLTTGGAMAWWWEFGDGDTSMIQNPQHYFQDTGTFIVTLIVLSPEGCRDTIQHPLKVNDIAFYIPNTFTPNEDDLNEHFFAFGIGITHFELSIFDRWGNLIFDCKVDGLPQSLPCIWDGKVKGGDQVVVQEDVYVYKVYYVSMDGQDRHLIGNLNVVR